MMMQETEKIMSLATRVRTKTETQRRHQMDTLDERRARHQTTGQQADAVFHVADKADQVYDQLRVGSQASQLTVRLYWL